MLVLSRKRDEAIMIGDDIEITLVDIRGDKVRLGINAPATIPVHRKEVYDAIQRETREVKRVRVENLLGLPKKTSGPLTISYPENLTLVTAPTPQSPTGGASQDTGAPNPKLPMEAPAESRSFRSDRPPSANRKWKQWY